MAPRDSYARDDERDRVGAHAAAAMPPSRLAILWRRRSTILATLAAFVVGGILYVAITPPRYLAATSILIDPRPGRSAGGDPLQPGDIPAAGAMDSQIKLLTSQTVLERVAKMADLAHVAEFNGSQRSFLQRLLRPLPGPGETVDLRALQDAITIKRPERSYVVAIEVLAGSAQRAADIANDIAKAYIDEQTSSRVGVARGDAAVVKDKLTTLSDGIKAAEDQLEASKTENGVADAHGLRSNEQRATDFTRSRFGARARVSDAKAALAAIDRMARSGRLDSSSSTLKSRAIERYRQEQAEADQDVARLAQTLGPDHPDLEAARARQRELSSRIRAELKRLRPSAQQNYEVALRHERQIVARIDGLERRSTEPASSLPELETLERDVKELRASFDRFSQLTETLAPQESELPPARVVAAARPPVSPARPNKTLAAVISLAGGLVFGLTAALLAERVSPQPLPHRHAPEAPPRYAEPESRYERAMRDAAECEPRPEPPRTRRRYWDDDDD